jgi:hypothetical protein
VPAPAGTCYAPCLSAPELTLSFRVSPDLTATGKPAAGSPGVLSPSAFAAPEARSPRVCLARHLPSSGFPSLLTACFLRSLPGFFHPGTLLGFSLQGVSPSQSLRTLSNAVSFVALAPGQTEYRSEPRMRTCLRSRAFKGLLSARIRHSPTLTFVSLNEPLPSWACGL